MNIFAIEGDADTGEIDWIKSAESQDNLRVVKMILESCQILSTVLNEQGLDAPYRSFNPKHPSCMWAAESAANFMSLVVHCEAMITEYGRRFGKTHKCAEVLNRIVGLFDADRFPPVVAYRKFYASKPRLRYPADKIPDWLSEYRTEPFEVVNG